jgi:hypothetical protein
MNQITIQIRNVYGEDKAYPMDHKAECIARIAGTKTLTQSTLANVRAMGFTIVELDRHGRPTPQLDGGLAREVSNSHRSPAA